MTLYKLLVYHAGDQLPRATIAVHRAADVVARIPEILTEHHACEHVLVTLNEVRLFAVDCHGNAVKR